MTTTTKTVPLGNPKLCSCGRTHTEIPVGAKLMEEGEMLDGYHFECKCGSHCFVPLKKVLAVYKQVS